MQFSPETKHSPQQSALKQPHIIFSLVWGPNCLLSFPLKHSSQWAQSFWKTQSLMPLLPWRYTHQSTWNHTPENSVVHSHFCKSLISHNRFKTSA
jgi:hypothetical protein